jgi:hypothetical protein
MPESLEGFSELQRLRHEVEDLKGITSALLRTQPDLAKGILRDLQGDLAMKRILMLTDGDRSQMQILEIVKGEGISGASLSGVSERISKLVHDYGLIAFDRRTRAGKIYRRTILDSALKISHTIEREAKKRG